MIGKILHRIWRVFLTILGDIKVYPFPMFIVYDPSSFRVKGRHTREAINVLKPGDVLVRKYKCYLDGWFIPGEYSHSAIYVGDGVIVHAVAEDVQEIDVIDFLRCDGFCILRQGDERIASDAAEMARSLVGAHYDFSFRDDNGDYYCHEMTAVCYAEMQIEKKPARILGIPVRPRYLASSFLEDPRFEKILEYRDP